MLHSTMVRDTEGMKGYLYQSVSGCTWISGCKISPIVESVVIMLVRSHKAVAR